MITPKEFVKALRSLSTKRGPSRIASDLGDVIHVLSAVRGPDDGHDWEVKERYTAPIRLWLLGAKLYDSRGFVPTTASRVDKLTAGRVRELRKELETRRTGSSHFNSHIASALSAIRRIEGWKE